MRALRLRVSLALLATAMPCGAFGQLYGPMSSGKPPEPPSAPTAPASASAPTGTALDVEKLFASTCGWCHSAGGRAAGKGPKLMGTTLTDAEIIQRVKSGKPGAMPSFATAFDDAQLDAIVKYIRGLRDEGTPR